MHKSTWWTACLVLAVFVAPVAALLGPWATQPALGLVVQDEELVLLEGNGRIKVVDPNIPAGYEEVDWQSGSTGWTAVTLGDFNGDGDQEILATKEGQARVFDPVVQTGQVAAGGEWTLSSPHTFYEMATGDIDGDGRDEIVLLRTDNAADILSQFLVYDGNSAGTSWTLTKQLEHGALWDDVELGDVDADGLEDIGLIRSDDNLLLIFDPASWTALHQFAYTFPWIDLEMIDVQAEGTPNKTEVALSRRGVLGYYNSTLVFRWDGNVAMQDVWGGTFYPYFTDIEGADLNGDGDDELVMYRPDSAPMLNLVARNPKGSSMRAFEPAGAFNPGGGWKDMEAGDLDGDGKDEVVLVRGTKYRIYDNPDTSDGFSDISGSWGASMAIGDLDGTGVATGPVLGVNPSTLSYTFAGTIPPAQAVFISNEGLGDEFDWTATITQGTSWLSISPAIGTTPSTLSIAVDPTILTTGSHTGQIRIDAEEGVGGSPRYINVTLSVVVTLPRLGVSPLALNFEMQQGRTNPSPQSVTVQNLGGGAPISWTASASVPWLEITPKLGSTPTTAWVEVHGQGLAPGTHAGSLTFASPGVIGSPYSLPVTLVVHPPVMEVNPPQLDLIASCSDAVQTRTLTVSQQGDGNDIDWVAVAVGPTGSSRAELLELASTALPEVTAQGTLLGGEVLPPVEWLSITPESGTTPQVVTIRVDPSTLDGGQHMASIIIVGWPGYVEDRVQLVDVNLFVADSCAYIPLLVN